MLAAGLARKESRSGSVLKYLMDTFASPGRALEVLVGANLLSDLLTLLGRDRLLARLTKLLDGLRVVSEILLATNKNDRKTLAEVKNLGNPLLLDVVERVGRVNREADEDHVGIGVGKRAETIVVFLASRIPKGQLNVFAINLNVGDVVFEDGRNVHLGESTLREDNQQAGFTAGTITNDDEFSADLSHGLGCEEKKGEKGKRRGN